MQATLAANQSSSNRQQALDVQQEAPSSRVTLNLGGFGFNMNG